MSHNLTYENPEGYTVFTSTFLSKRGTCCKTACLHCPYGFTLKKHGLTFREVTEADFPLIEKITAESDTTQVDWMSFHPGHIKIILLKDVVCGYLLKNHLVIKHLFLLPHFDHQGLSREMVEAYLF